MIKTLIKMLCNDFDIQVENSRKDIVDVEKLRQRCNKLTKIMKYDRKRKAVICFRKSLKVIIIFIGLNLCRTLAYA